MIFWYILLFSWYPVGFLLSLYYWIKTYRLLEADGLFLAFIGGLLGYVMWPLGHFMYKRTSPEQKQIEEQMKKHPLIK